MLNDEKNWKSGKAEEKKRRKKWKRGREEKTICKIYVIKKKRSNYLKKYP